MSKQPREVADASVLSEEEALYARKFWRDLALGDLASHLFVGRTLELRRKWASAAHADDLEDDTDALLQGLGYATTMKALLDERETAKHDLAFWRGDYLLFDDEGTRYQLHVDEAATIVTRGETYTSFRFVEGELSGLVGDRNLKLRFALPPSPAESAKNESEIAGLLKRTQPRCTGTVHDVHGQNEPHGISGKRGCFTREGVDRFEDGDAPELWRGIYAVCAQGDDDLWTYTDENIQVVAIGDQVALGYGNHAGKDIVYGNNAVVFSIGDSGDRFAGVFMLNGDGSKRIDGMIRSEDGATRRVTAFWTGDPPDALQGVYADAVTDVNTTQETDTPEPTTNRTVFRWDLKTHDPTVIYELPRGNERNSYVLRIVPINLPASAKGRTLTWTRVPDEEHDGIPFPVHIKTGPDWVVTDKAVEINRHPTAVLDAAWGETQHALIYKFTVHMSWTPAEATTAERISIKFRLKVESLANMVISPEQLPPVISGRQYSVGVSATGGSGKYLWSWDEADLPGDITFNTNKALFHGGTTDSQATASTTVTVRSDESLQMEPTNITYILQVKEPEQIGWAIAGWCMFAMTAVGLIFTAGAWIYDKHSEKKEKEKENKSVERGIESAGDRITNGKFVEGILKDAKTMSTQRPADVSFKKTEAKLDGIVQKLQGYEAAAKTAFDHAKQQVATAQDIAERDHWERELQKAERDHTKARERTLEAEAKKREFDRDVRNQPDKQTRQDALNKFVA